MRGKMFRDLIRESTPVDVREAFDDEAAYVAFANRGRDAVARALAGADRVEEAEVLALHRGLGVLLRLLRRRDGLSVEELARAARVDPAELTRIESDASYDPSPRTIYQLEEHFRLPARSLVLLSGAQDVGDDVRSEAIRFAASADGISTLSRAERKLLNSFVAFLKAHTDS